MSPPPRSTSRRNRSCTVRRFNCQARSDVEPAADAASAVAIEIIESGRSTGFCGIGLVILTPLLLAVAAAITPRQPRPGILSAAPLRLQPAIRIIKFRTMHTLEAKTSAGHLTIRA
jgi:lipopolysaccharide/colanic/teichoic acid biosynthesis glycosyltransferase